MSGKIDRLAQLLQFGGSARHLVRVPSGDQCLAVNGRCLRPVARQPSVSSLQCVGHRIAPQFQAGIVHESGNQPLSCLGFDPGEQFKCQPPSLRGMRAVADQRFQFVDRQRLARVQLPLGDRLDHTPQPVGSQRSICLKARQDLWDLRGIRCDQLLPRFGCRPMVLAFRADGTDGLDQGPDIDLRRMGQGVCPGPGQGE